MTDIINLKIYLNILEEKRSESWKSKNDEQKQQVEKKLLQEERQVTSYLTLATRTLETFNGLTQRLKNFLFVLPSDQFFRKRN